MNKEIKAKWVAALRSGDYKQAKNQLRKTEDGHDSFCCLGVLCDVINPDGWDDGNRFLGNMSLLPPDAMRIAGIDTLYVVHEHDRPHLTELNDGRGLNFNQIADLIEEQL